MVARAAMGATYYVWSTHNASTWGLIKQVRAMRHGVATVPDGPATELLSAARRRMVLGRSGVPSVGANQRQQLRDVGGRELRGVLPLLDRLPADEAAQIRAWLVDVAIGVARAGRDRGTGRPISDREAAAIEEVGAILADPVRSGPPAGDDEEDERDG